MGDGVALRVVVCAAFAVGLWLSPKLWQSHREVALAPVFPWLPTPSEGEGALVLVTLYALLAAIAVLGARGPLVWALLVVVVTLCLLDQNRMQPWVLQYTLMLGSLGLAPSDAAATRDCRLLLAAIYVFSGVHKLNTNFVERLFLHVVEPVAFALPSVALHPYAITLVPFVETALGLGLLWRPSFRVAQLGLAGMHALICTCLWLRQWNLLVLPWNAAMVLCVALVGPPSSDAKPSASSFTWVVVLFAVALPVLSLPVFGLYPCYAGFVGGGVEGRTSL